MHAIHLRRLVGIFVLTLAGCEAGEDPADLQAGDPRGRPDLGVERGLLPSSGGAGGGMGGMMFPEGCPQTINFTGQVVGPEAAVPNGGTPSFTAPSNDSGIGAVKAAIANGEAMVDLTITEAVVSATSFLSSRDVPASQTRFWIEDASGALEVSLPDEAAPPFDMQVGNVISFKVSAVSANGEITGASEWQLVNVDQPVYIFEPDRPLTLDDVGRNIRITGLLEGEPVSCGGSSRCWNSFDYGQGAVILRSSSSFLSPGLCVTFVGPLRQFNGDLQIDTINFDWHTNHQEE